MDTRWWRALWMEERLAGARPHAAVDAAARERAHLASTAWRAEAPFAEHPELLARRLARSGLDDACLLALLAESAEDLRARLPTPPAWSERLARALAPRAGGTALELGPLAADPTAGFLRPFEALVADARDELSRRLAAHARRGAGAPFTPAAAALCVPSLALRLHELASRTLVLELHVARLEGALSGATAEERFSSFVERLARPSAARDLFGAWPVLARRAAEACALWVAACDELFGRLADDHGLLGRLLPGGRTPGELTELSLGRGDLHRGGRSVAVLGFEGGERLVYKPRSLAVDVRFAALVERLDALGLEPALRAPAALDRGTHGWAAHVAPAPASSPAAVERFHLRLGAWLALFHALDAIDLHFENLIAAGEHPVPVDLETLFHPRLPAPRLPHAGRRAVRRALEDSVLRTGLLPQRVGVDDDFAGADLSGLGGAPGELTPDPVLAFDAPATDEMRATRRRLPMPAGANRAALRGAPAAASAPARHVEEIVAGFESTWRLLRANAEELLAPSGALQAFADDPVRVVLRPTRLYGLLASTATHPDPMGDGLELERLLDRLWVGVDAAPHLEAAIASERAALLRGDVPCFGTTPGSRALVLDGGQRIEGFFPETPLESVATRLARADERELARQSELIRASVAAAATGPEDLRWPRSGLPREAPVEPDGAELAAHALALARGVGERLADGALAGDDGLVTWAGWVFERGRWTLDALPDDLYAGSSGVALFLAWLARCTGEGRFDELAHAALVGLRRRLWDGTPGTSSVGAFSGLGGLVHSLSQIGALRGDGELLADAERAAELSAHRVDEDRDLDVVGGAAGLIGALRALDAVRPRARWRDIALAAGAHLARSARPVPGADGAEALGWRTRLGGAEPVSGFSHGAAGIAWALAILGRWSGEQEWFRLAQCAIAGEDALFDAARGSWSDPGGRLAGRDPAERDETLMCAWCYGAPGIGTARLDALDAGLERAREDVGHALRATLREGFGRNHSLCHGDLGNLDFLLRAAERLPDAGRAREVRRISARVVASVAASGPVCGMPQGLSSPALMNGLAGIGLGLLRLARPHEVPSILALEPLRVP